MVFPRRPALASSQAYAWSLRDAADQPSQPVQCEPTQPRSFRPIEVRPPFHFGKISAATFDVIVRRPVETSSL